MRSNFRRSKATRRAFLAAAVALAPAAAACASAQEAPPQPPPANPAAPSSDPLADIRAFRVPLGTEPAFVFRALPPAAGGSAK